MNTGINTEGDNVYLQINWRKKEVRNIKEQQNTLKVI
jgi:hypothetical protein